jgi:MoxR-like ATPase
MEQYNFYENKAVNAAVQLPKIERGEGYMPSEGLVRALNVALMLQKPLLVTGVPGTGKSDLAYHIADRFGWGDVLPFATRTDSVSTDLLYRYDSLAHFHKVNLEKGTDCELTAKKIEENYIHYEALGRAICDSIGQNKEEQRRRRVVLIDEIDKAPRDLPNDILSIIESMSFEVPELKSAKETDRSFYRKEGDEAYKPVVILTSNSEKTLPEPFLRRCVYFHIDMPDKEQLMKILLKKERILPNLDEKSAAKFIDLFLQISDLVTGKKPATHELILWIWWMQKHRFSDDDLINFRSTSANAETLLSGMSILAKEESDLKAALDAIEKHKLKG